MSAIIEENESFDDWNELKKKINKRNKKLKFKNKDIFFISIGKNVGYEQYGKGKEFLRPVLVLKKLSKETFFGIPLTSKEKVGNYYFSFKHRNKISTAMFNQARVFDIKRVKFSYGSVGRNTFEKIRRKFSEFIDVTPHINGEDGTKVQKDNTILSKKDANVKKRIFLSAPHMSGNELKYIEKVFESNYIAPLGEYVNKFEESVKAYTGTPYALAVSSGTAAIHLALRVLGVQEGDDVLASTFTFIGSVNAILYQRANPVFIDSEENSWNLSPELLREYLQKCRRKPKALIVTHLYGMSADIEEIAKICKENGVFLIEDAAESLGATFNGRHTGTFGDFGIYSFNGNKILTTSGGGMLVTPNKEWRDKALFYATQSKEPFLHYEHKEFGYNYRMSNVLAAIGVAQMEVIEERVKKKREIFRWYKKHLSDIDEVRFMSELQNSRGNRWLTALTFEKSNYMKIIEALEKINVESRPLWKPMHLQPLFKDAARLIDGTSERLFAKGLCLASSTTMSEEDVATIAKTIKEEVVK